MATVFDLLNRAGNAVAQARSQAVLDAAHHARAIKQWAGIVDGLYAERREMAATIERMEREANVRAAK